MTITRMPGFTADESVYTTGERYRRAMKSSDSSREQRVVAQLRNSFGCAGCVWSCFIAGGAPFLGCYNLCRALDTAICFSS
jgi:hypothetical protein